MSLNTLTNQTITLAGVVQACRLVHQLATLGQADPIALEASLNSLLKIDSENVLDVYGNLQGIRCGLEQLDAQLSGKLFNNPEQARYTAQLIYLQKKLLESDDLTQLIHQGILKAQLQAAQYGVLHTNVQANFADIYHSTISTLQPRILIMGDQNYLSTQAIVNKIRALLLAGIRSVLLWRQCGGQRWQLLLFRKKIQREARFLLTQI